MGQKKMKITKEKLMEIIKEEVESTLQEDGHEDVPSAVRAMKTIIEDAGQILQALEGMDGTLPTWWTNKMAVASSKMNSMRDYLLVDSEEAMEEYNHITEATYDDGTVAEDVEFWDDVLEEAEYRGRKVKLNKPTRGDVKKFKVYVKDPKTGNVKKVTWGDTTGLKVKLSDKEARKSFAARHDCENAKDRTKASYWACNLPRYAKQLGLSGGGNFFW